MNADTCPAAPDPACFRVPAIRHLAWMCQVPQLTDSPLAFDLRPWLPAGTAELLEGWERLPHTAPAALLEPAPPRLGYYFERLYACLLTDILGWEVLARNLPIRNTERTLGELDFVVRNPQTQAVEHHEIAIKFYLGYPGPGTPTRWYGPNAVDRLDLKTARMLEHQCQRGQLAESATALAAQGIDVPTQSRLFMPGYLFYPVHSELGEPDGVPSDHQRGRWTYLEAARGMDTACWVHLRKPHWLGPWVQSEQPDPAAVVAALEQIAATDTPRLFAQMQRDSSSGLWREVDRVFVVPASWPG